MSEVLNFCEKGFPTYIKVYTGMPDKLHFLGQLPENLERRGLGIVGSRRVSPYGIRVLKELFYFLRGTDVVVVSGFTIGVDSLAHTLALESGCKTIAVMPCGCDIVHPAENAELYKKILNGGGALVSEFEDGFRPMKWTYPKRNRVIAALSKHLLVIEASLKSGSMITARYGLKYGKKVYCVPGDIYMERSRGTNELISEGAGVYLSAEYFLRELRSGSVSEIWSGGSELDKKGMSFLEKRILEVLENGQKNYDALAATLAADFSELNTALSNLVLRGDIGEKGGTYFVL